MVIGREMKKEINVPYTQEQMKQISDIYKQMKVASDKRDWTEYRRLKLLLNKQYGISKITDREKMPFVNEFNF